MACRSGCRTQDHKSWGECLRSSNLQLNAGEAKHDQVNFRRWDNELQLYRDARAQGVQPAGTTTAKIRQAMEISEKTGKAFNAERPQDSIIV